MPPTSAVQTRTRSQRAQTTNAVPDDAGDSDAIPDAVVLEQPLPSELFLDPLQGSPLHFYVHEDVEDRSDINRLIRIHGGASSSSYTNANYILVDPRSAAGQNLYIQFYNNKKGKTVLDSRWVKECVQAKELLAWRSNWAGCRVTGKERDEYIQAQQANAQPIPPPPSPTHPTNLDASASQQPDSSDELDPDVMEVDQLRGREETPPPPPGESPGQLAPVTPQQSDPHRSTPHMYYSPHPLVYGYPPPRPGAPMPAPMPWPYMPNGHPMPMPVPMFAPPPPPHPDGQEGQPPTLTGAYPQFDYQHAQGYSNAWMEYYAQMDPNMYARQMEEHTGYLMQSPGAESDNEKRRRGRTRTRNLAANSARIAVKPMGPPARSPSPPTNVVKSTYGGNLFTDEDVQYLKRYIAYCQEQGLLLSLREICERLAIKAPHHTFFSWRRYCNKHQIRLGAYTMEDRQEDVDGEDESTMVNESADTEPATTSQSIPGGSGTSKTTRSGSPVPPKILYKSTTGKGVAFTQDDVQYLMDYMRYRKSKSEQLDMVEFWNDLSERAPHHSRASWMKYWRRHRHELEPNGDQPPAPAYIAPAKKSRYTHKDDILLAKYFFELEGQDSSEKKTSDVIFQEFAAAHAHHPWKGWQEHHRIHKARIDHMVKQMKEGEEF